MEGQRKHDGGEEQPEGEEDEECGVVARPLSLRLLDERCNLQLRFFRFYKRDLTEAIIGPISKTSEKILGINFGSTKTH